MARKENGVLRMEREFLKKFPWALSHTRRMKVDYAAAA